MTRPLSLRYPRGGNKEEMTKKHLVLPKNSTKLLQSKIFCASRVKHKALRKALYKKECAQKHKEKRERREEREKERQKLGDEVRDE